MARMLTDGWRLNSNDKFEIELIPKLDLAANSRPTPEGMWDVIREANQKGSQQAEEIYRNALLHFDQRAARVVQLFRSYGIPEPDIQPGVIRYRLENSAICLCTLELRRFVICFCVQMPFDSQSYISMITDCCEGPVFTCEYGPRKLDDPIVCQTSFATASSGVEIQVTIDHELLMFLDNLLELRRIR